MRRKSMSKEQLKKEILRQILELEKKNIYNGYQKTKEQMVAEIESIIISEVEKHENRKN